MRRSLITGRQAVEPFTSAEKNITSGSLVMPAWWHFDPLPVLGGSHSERERRRKEAERERLREAALCRGLRKLLDLES